MPKTPLEAYIPNLGGVVEQFWLRWIQQICLWIPPAHWLLDGMGKTFDA
jgi:hypothetical protein